MPRRARVIVPNYPHHIVQRGHNRKAIFVEPEDYEYYLSTLSQWKKTLEITVYSYCLMTNHIHLILKPGDDTQTISQLLKRLAGRQTRYVNKQAADKRGQIYLLNSQYENLQTKRLIEKNRDAHLHAATTRFH